MDVFRRDGFRKSHTMCILVYIHSYLNAPRIPPGQIEGWFCVAPGQVFGHLGSAFPPSEPAGIAVETWGPFGGPREVRGGPLEGPRAPKMLSKCLREFLERLWSVLGDSWGGFGGLGCSLGQSWEVRMLLFRMVLEGFLEC